MSLNTLQQAILEELDNNCGDSVGRDHLVSQVLGEGAENDKLKQLYFELQSLEEEQLVKVLWVNSLDGKEFLDAQIRPKGRDRLSEDGGLTAEQHIVTVRFDIESLREAIAAGLLTPNVPEEKQGALMKAIREAPGTMLQTAVTKMVEKGMSDPVGTAKAVAGLFGITW